MSSFEPWVSPAGPIVLTGNVFFGGGKFIAFQINLFRIGGEGRDEPAAALPLYTPCQITLQKRVVVLTAVS